MTAPALTLGVRAAAEYVGVSLSSFYLLVAEKAIACERVPHGRIRITLAELDRFKRQCVVDAMPRVRSPRRRCSPRNPKPDLAAAARRFDLTRLEAERGAR
jgi:excisionase family DNA binding protein